MCLCHKTIYLPIKREEIKRSQEKRENERKKYCVSIYKVYQREKYRAINLVGSIIFGFWWIKWVDLTRYTYYFRIQFISGSIKKKKKWWYVVVEDESVNRYTWIRFSRWLLCAIDYSHRRFKSLYLTVHTFFFCFLKNEFRVFFFISRVYIYFIWMKFVDIWWVFMIMTPIFKRCRPEGTDAWT